MSEEKVDLRKSDNNYQYIFKIILLGDANTGKTCLINRYINRVYNDKYICTIGVDFMMKSIIYDDKIIKLQIWDTAGMEKYKQITISYFRGAQAAILCFDLTNKSTFDSLNKWVKDYSQFHKSDNTIIIVGNKSDLLSEREVLQEDIDNFVEINKFIYFETSAKSGDNVDNLFFYLAKHLYEINKINTNQVRNSVQIKNSGSVDKFQNIMLETKKNSCKC